MYIQFDEASFLSLPAFTLSETKFVFTYSIGCIASTSLSLKTNDV